MAEGTGIQPVPVHTVQACKLNLLKMKNITKDKGDVGVAMVIADLARNGFKVALPVSDHLPFDLIAISPSGRMFRFSVKHRHRNKRGCVEASTRSVYSNGKGSHTKYADKNWIDGIALYCPETEAVYYVPVKALGLRKSINLRITVSASKKAVEQAHRSIRADQYANLEKWR